MGRLFTGSVWVTSPDGTATWFGPGSELPDWARAEITNPKCWGDDDPRRDPGYTVAVEPGPAAPSIDDRPPKAGAGSGLDEWIRCAESLGIDVPENPSRGDVIELVEQHDAAKQKD